MLTKVLDWFDRRAGGMPGDVAEDAIPAGPVALPIRADPRPVPVAIAQRDPDDARKPVVRVDMLAQLQASVNAGVAGNANRSKITEAFNASQPVGDRYELSGRVGELAGLVNAVIDGANHAIIYGARGVGKTSLARVFGDLVDEAGCDVFYHSASGDADFEQVVLPYVRFIEETATRTQPIRPAMLGATFSARDVADALADVGSRHIFLILDEFDRITNERTRSELAALLKLLSDFRIRIQFVIVGISNDVDALIAAHPSLRRHMAAIRVGPIQPDAVASLIAEGGRRAGLDFAPSVVDAIASFSIGSPYHARSLARDAGLRAWDSRSDSVDEVALWSGIDGVWRDWAGVSAPAARLFARLAPVEEIRDGLVVAALLAGHEYEFDEARLAEAIVDATGRPPAEAARLSTAVLTTLAGELRDADGKLAFADSLAPQYLLLALLRRDRLGGDVDLAERAREWNAMASSVGGMA